jgi:hypothetical protein
MSLKLRSHDLDWRQIDSDIVVLDARTASYLALNGSAALLWGRLAVGATRDELVHALHNAYEVDETTAAADTDAFLSSLVEQGLLAS